MVNKLLSQLKLGKSFIIFSVLKILGEGFFYLTPLLLASFFSPAEFGNFSLVQMIVIILATILLTSSQTPFIVNANKEDVIHKKINKSFTIQSLFFSATLIVGTLVIVLFKKQLIIFTGIPYNQYLFIILFFCSISLKTFFENLLLSLNKKKSSAYYALAIGIINILIILFINWTVGIKLAYVFSSYLFATVIPIIFFLKVIDFKKLFPLYLEKKQLIEVLKWTSWQVFGLLSVQLINWGDNIVLRRYVSLEKIGVYNVAYQLFKGLIGASYLINTYFLPFISQNTDNPSKIDDYLKNKRPKIMVVCLLGLASCWFFVPSMLDLIYDNRYEEAGIIFRILLLGVGFHLYSVFYIPIINAFKKYKIIQLINVVHVLLNLILDIVLIKYFDNYGAAIATSLSYLIAAILIGFYSRKIKASITFSEPDKKELLLVT